MTFAQRPPLHVVQIGFFNDPHRRTPQELLQSWTTLSDVAQAACRGGLRVSVVQASAHSEHLERNGVHYYFGPFGQAAAARARQALAELLRELGPDVLHVHGLDFPREVLSLPQLAPEVPIILQDHASRPPRAWRRWLWRRSIGAAAGVAFCALDQAQPFARAGLLRAPTRVYEIPESTSHFVPGDPREARQLTGVEGDPAVLWVGHLDTNKDPLTVLAGVSAAIRALPGLRLYCCFGAAPLLPQVQQMIASDPGLRQRVTLLGRVPHERVEQLLRAADIFVLGSHREGSGYALIEALACGLPPVVTDIPSFRTLTGGGAVGALWRCGDAPALAAALQQAAAHSGAATRAAVRAHFERELSSAALGAKLAAMYADVTERGRSTPKAECALHQSA
ncbi:MAG TPA: glycosyltransferase family 4 protein [Steroidobacteraceae bacterium]|nr:glycosyltransferase family 4 protein [Steroidobacteraceae bacterium]